MDINFRKLDVKFGNEEAELELIGVKSDDMKKYDFLVAAHKRGAFSGSLGSAFEHMGKAYIGLGKKISDTESLRRALGSVNPLILSKRIPTVKVNVKSFAANDKVLGRTVLEALYIGTHLHIKYKTKQVPTPIEKIIFDKKSKLLEEGAKIGLAMAEGQCLVMDLANEPSNELHPETFCKFISSHGKKLGLKVTILNEADLKKEKMNCLLAVGQGSSNRPKMAIIEYKPKGAKKTIALVGKGVTFDSGGISIKPSDGMELMKKDMTGAGCVIGALHTLSKLKPKNHIVGIIPMAENMPDGEAIVPGSVVKSRKGIQVEIINTDAEGRLILCDALDYAHKFNPDAIIDIATLTGASIIALGPVRSAVMVNNEKIFKDLDTCGNETGERVWRLPLDDDYKMLMDSDTADIKNSGDRKAGTIYGGKFLEMFVDPKVAWAHLDIACTSWGVNYLSYLPKKGSSGIGARLMAEYCLK